MDCITTKLQLDFVELPNSFFFSSFTYNTWRLRICYILFSFLFHNFLSNQAEQKKLRNQTIPSSSGHSSALGKTQDTETTDQYRPYTSSLPTDKSPKSSKRRRNQRRTSLSSSSLPAPPTSCGDGGVSPAASRTRYRPDSLAWADSDASACTQTSSSASRFRQFPGGWRRLFARGHRARWPCAPAYTALRPPLLVAEGWLSESTQRGRDSERRKQVKLL